MRNGRGKVRTTGQRRGRREGEVPGHCGAAVDDHSVVLCSTRSGDATARLERANVADGARVTGVLHAEGDADGFARINDTVSR